MTVVYSLSSELQESKAGRKCIKLFHQNGIFCLMSFFIKILLFDEIEFYICTAHQKSFTKTFEFYVSHSFDNSTWRN